MKNVFLQKIRIPAAFLLVHSAILNALFADNRHFFVFAVGGTFFSALLLFCCIKEDEGRAYKTVFSVLFSAASAFAVPGIFGNIICYRIGAILFLIISASEMIRLEIRAGKRAFAHIAAVVFAYIPLIAALCFTYCDVKPELRGNGTVTVIDNGGYEKVSKRTYTTDRGYSIIYYPETDGGAELPVIAYLHGFYAYNNSDKYEETFYYLASCGYIVIAPNYESIFYNPANYSGCASRQIADGIKFAENRLKAKPAKKNNEYLIGLVGHSVGAITALNICAEHIPYLPEPSFVVALDASDGGADIIPKDDLQSVGDGVNVIMAAGADDTKQCFDTSAYFWERLKDHPEDRKAFYVLYSDSHKEEYVTADHLWIVPNGSSVDNLRRYGVLKWCRAIADWSFYGENRELCYGDGALYMGEWSDGVELKRAASGIEAIYR